jgi:caffeoyl-CoA O-methyltransferase
MAASPDEVQLLGLLIEMLGAKNAVEVGVFTGYSLLATALALPDNGKVSVRAAWPLHCDSAICLCLVLRAACSLLYRICALGRRVLARQIVAIDVTRESYDQIGSPVIDKAGVAHKIDFRVGLALPVLDQMVAEVKTNYTAEPHPSIHVQMLLRRREMTPAAAAIFCLSCRRGTRAGSTSPSWTRTR